MPGSESPRRSSQMMQHARALFSPQHRQRAQSLQTQTQTQPQRPASQPLQSPSSQASYHYSIPKLSRWSSLAVRDSLWSSLDFMLGAGMVLIQPSTQKIVVVYEEVEKHWFLPRGRKDVGESLERTALREAYEESGYRATFFPLLNPTHQPLSPEMRQNPSLLNTEPIYVTVSAWQPRRKRDGRVEPTGGEYLTMWYIGQIPHDAVREEGTGMPDEQNFKSHLLSFDEALENLHGQEKAIVTYAWNIFQDTERAISEAQNPPPPLVESPEEIERQLSTKSPK